MKVVLVVMMRYRVAVEVTGAILQAIVATSVWVLHVTLIQIVGGLDAKL